MTRELEVLADLARRSARVDGESAPDAELRRLGQAWRRRGRKRTVVTLSAALSGLAVAAVAVFLVGLTPVPDPLTYAVEGDVAWTDGHVDVRGKTGARMSFSDGTHLDLSRATRAQVAAIDEHGARLRLQAGRARAGPSRRAPSPCA